MLQSARAILSLARPDTSLLAFLAVFLPTLTRTNDLNLSFSRALPMLFISICTFIVNDIDDIEKDKINHPDRPLPSGQIGPALAVAAYYLFLVSALAAIRLLIAPGYIAFLHYSLLVLVISYGYVVDYLPAFKPAYVAIAASVPPFITSVYFRLEQQLAYVAVAFGIFTLGRELCKDLLDRPGDPVSVIHRIRPRQVAQLAFFLQLVGLAIVARQSSGKLDLLLILAMALVLGFACVNWFEWKHRKLSLMLMKAVAFLGLYFLL